MPCRLFHPHEPALHVKMFRDNRCPVQSALRLAPRRVKPECPRYELSRPGSPSPELLTVHHLQVERWKNIGLAIGATLLRAPCGHRSIVDKDVGGPRQNRGSNPGRPVLPSIVSVKQLAKTAAHISGKMPQAALIRIDGFPMRPMSRYPVLQVRDRLTSGCGPNPPNRPR